MKFASFVYLFAIRVAATVLAVSVSVSADAAAENIFDAKLPGAAGVEQLSDGAWVCPTGLAAYLSASDTKNWALVQTGLPSDRWVMQCLGGSQNRMFLVASTGRWGSNYAIYAVEPGRKPINVRSLPPGHPAAFCSESIGVVATGVLVTGANADVTVDGGATWHSTPPLFDAKDAHIALIQRVDNSRLLLSDSRSLTLYEVQHDATLHQLWRVTPPGGVGTTGTQVSVRDPTHLWLRERAGVTRLKLADGEADLVVPWNIVGADSGDVIKVFVVWDNALIVWSRDSQKMRALNQQLLNLKSEPASKQVVDFEGLEKMRSLTQKADGTYAAGRWFPTNGYVFTVVPTVKPHCLLLDIKGEAKDFDLAADTLTPMLLHVVPPTPKPGPSPATAKLLHEDIELSRQLPFDEASAIGERILKRKDLSNDQQIELETKEFQLAIDKHKADGTLLPRQKSLYEQLEDLGHQLTGKEQSDILVEARQKRFATGEQTQLWMKEQYEKLIAQHKAEGTVPKSKSDLPDEK